MKLSQLFDVFYGSNVNLSDIDFHDNLNNNIPYVSRTEKNNGVSSFVPFQKNVKINPKHTLSVALGGSVLETFYQPVDYYSGRDLAYLKPLIPMTKEEMIFYAICIRSNKIKYSYGRQANRTLKDLELPDFNKIPAWINNHHLKSLSINKTNNLINIDNFSNFNVSTFFDVVSGNSGTINDLEDENGTVPVISSSGLNNGISCYSNKIAKFSGNKITVAINGSVGSSFYQKNAFLGTSDIAVLSPLPNTFLNENIAIYISTIIIKESKIKYSYGRKISLPDLKNMIIKLPVDSNNQPDWNYINQYIQKIKNQYS